MHDSLPAQLTPARRARLVYNRWGLRVVAESDGESALVLPAQYSHCWSAPPGVKLFRANVMQLGLLFRGNIDLQLTYRLGPMWAGECRFADLADMRRLDMASAGR